MKYNGKWGIIDRTGRFIVQPFLDISPGYFNEGYAVADGQEGKLGFLNMKGEWAISPQYRNATSFCEGLAAVQESDKWGFINPKGDYVIPPEYEDTGIFREGLVAVKKNGKWGFINPKGDYVIQPKYEDTRVFREGLAAVKKDGKWGFINKFNQWEIKPCYDDVKYFSYGYAAVKIGENWGVISSNGESISPFQYKSITLYETYYEARDEHGWHKKEYPKEDKNLIQKEKSN